MNLTAKNAKNLISKDSAVSMAAAKEILESCDFEAFETLCKNSSSIFDFIADKIKKNLLNATNKENINTTFEFSKIYDPIMGEYIINSWLKYADEDLTDSILELFNSGNEAQKTYAALYFEKINDPLALEYLNNYAFCDNDELSSACAAAIKSFGDTQALDIARTMLREKNDDFKKFQAIKFIITYGAKEDYELVLHEIKSSPLGANIAAEFLYKYGFEAAKTLLDKDNLYILYDTILGAYPEDLALESVYDLDFENFIDLVLNDTSSVAKRILADAKNLFSLVCSDNIYTYDLNKQHLFVLQNINKKLQKINIQAKEITPELFKSQTAAQKALNALINMSDSEAVPEIEKLYSNSNDPLLLCECARAAKNLGFKLDINHGLNNIEDNNALALFKSYF